MNDEKQSKTIDFRYAPDIVQTCIGLADDFYKSIVREDGSLNYHFQGEHCQLWDPLLRVGEQKAVYPLNTMNMGFRYRYKPTFFHRDRMLDQKQDYGDAQAAFVTTIERYAHTELEWEVVAYSDGQGLRADIIRWKLTALEGFGHAHTKVILCALGLSEGGPQILSFPHDQNVFLQEGECWEGVYVIVLKGELSKEQVSLEWANLAKEQMRLYWNNLKPFHHAFEIPDQQIQDMLHACGRNILQAREVNEGVYELQVGPTMYRGLWMVDGYFLLEAAHMMGRSEEAYQGLLAVQRRIRPDGSIAINPDHHKETGIALATFVRQCELMNDDERLRELWPSMQRALLYIRGKREEAFAKGPSYLGYELFTPSFGDGGLHGPAPELTTPLWTLFGLKVAYEAGKRLNLPGCEAFGHEYEDLSSSLRKVWERHMKCTESGIPYVYMSLEPELDHLPQTGTWALAQSIAPGEVFFPNDPLVTNFLKLLDEVDDQQGLPVNTGWRKDQAVWSYSAMFYAQVWLYAGYPEKAVNYLYAFANHASSSRVWREEQPLKESRSNEFCGDMPHNWGSAEFIRLVRHLVVVERLGDLVLFPGLPKEWIPTSKQQRLMIEQTPTRYGKVTVELTMEQDDLFTLQFSLSPGNQHPRSILLNWKGSVAQSDIDMKQIQDGVWEMSSHTGKATLKLRLDK
ncbi:MAG: hypothetical protein H7X86_08165 [Gorillibacterium sp.]|nr:hypothetical protein [Gorillibacterium sp.]